MSTGPEEARGFYEREPRVRRVLVDGRGQNLSDRVDLVDGNLAEWSQALARGDDDDRVAREESDLAGEIAGQQDRGAVILRAGRTAEPERGIGCRLGSFLE